MAKIYITAIEGTHGCHNANDEQRAVQAAEAVLKLWEVDPMHAYTAYIFKTCDDQDVDEFAYNAWCKACRAAGTAFTLGWFNGDNVSIDLAVRS